VTDRFSSASRKILALPDWPLPNAPGQGTLGINLNYLAAINYQYDRDQIDSKVNFNITPKWTSFARLSWLKYRTDNPPPFGILAGPGVHPTDNRPGKGGGATYSGTVSTTYAASPNLVFDAYFGAMLLDTNALFPDMDKNVGRDILGMPGTNGTTSFAGGMVRMPMDGFSTLGNANQSPFIGRDYQYQYVANGNWSRGSHEIRFGADFYRLHLNQGVANGAGAIGGPSGGFTIRNATTTLRGGAAANDYNTLRVVRNGSLLTYTLNGGLVCSVRDDTYASGAVVVSAPLPEQKQGGSVAVKSVELKPLGGQADASDAVIDPEKPVRASLAGAGAADSKPLSKLPAKLSPEPR